VNITTECTKENDGYHTHEFHLNDGTARTVEEHRHTWMDEHQARWPNSRRVEVRRGRYEKIGGYHTVAEAWKALEVGEPIPAVSCG
jgi:hypothetical protein